MSTDPSCHYPSTIARYVEASAALHDRHGCLSVAETGQYFRRLVRHASPSDGPAPDLLSAMRELILVYADGHRHTRLKQLIKHALATRVTGAAAGLIDETVDSLLDQIAPLGRMDIVRDFAGPLPVILITRLLGLSVDDLDCLRQWSDDLATIVGPDAGSPEKLARAQRSAAALYTYLRAIVTRRRAHPEDDVMSDLIVNGEQTGLIESEDELIANIAFLLIAGHESTAFLIASGICLLLRHPEQLARLRADPKLIDSAVRETLRLASPVQMVARVAGDERHLVRVLLGEANRDPEAYTEPDRFDISRFSRGIRPHPPPQLAFGAGDHRCLGAALAITEARSAIGTLVSRFPDLALATDQVEWRDSAAFRALISLPVTFRPARSAGSPRGRHLAEQKQSPFPHVQGNSDC